MKTPPSVLMMPFSTVYRVVTSARLAAYRNGFFRTTRLTVPVISVGNITTGGTGKTPLVEWVCRAIADDAAQAKQRKSICVLTRGYGKANPSAQVVVSDGDKLLASQREAGDEPLLLATNLLGIAAVISNPDRISAGEWAIKSLGAEVFVLDDGFQHLRIARDLDIVTIDATNPFGGGELLPNGRLREPIDGLSRAGCIVITRTDQVEDISSVADDVRRGAAECPVFLSRMINAGVTRIGGERIDREELINQPLAAFCGVGNPRSFFHLLTSEGLRIVKSHAFGDHHRYSQQDIDALVEQAQTNGVQGLITTAKDATKLSAFNFPLPCYVLEIKIVIEDEQQLRAMIQTAVLSP